ncbi:MAG: hypothetical protein R3345_08275 [Fulvivirga sp.]|nr:hypothetical protein [Fulvivirga sp.]
MLAGPINEALAQCAMCRATVENNVSNGEMGIAAGLNLGILYLFIMPYLLIGLVAFFWYRNSKSNAKKQQHKRHIVG